MRSVQSLKEDLRFVVPALLPPLPSAHTPALPCAPCAELDPRRFNPRRTARAPKAPPSLRVHASSSRCAVTTAATSRKGAQAFASRRH